MRCLTKSKMVKKRILPKAVRVDEFPKLIRTVPKKDMVAKVAFLLAYGAGMRISEVLRCSKEHFRSNSVYIPSSKYGVERTVPIPKGWKEEYFEVMPIGEGRSIVAGSRALQRRFEKYRRKANLNPDYTFHSLRHGFATRCLESGMPLNQVQVLVGHANIKTTSIYVKANPLDAIKSYEKYF